MKTCLGCWHAEDSPPYTRHCGDCPCCSRCVVHKLAGCPLCEHEFEDGD